MSPCRCWWAIPVVLGLAIALHAEDSKAKKPSLDSIPPVPLAAVVKAIVPLEPKDFTAKIEDDVRVVIDPDFDVDDPDYEKKNVRREKATTSFEMVYIPAGEVTIGSPDGEAGREANEGPQQKVRVPAFWMAKYETSWELFDLWYRSGNLPRRDEAVGKYESDKANAGKTLPPDAITRPTNPYVSDDYGHGREGKPALCMSHHAAMMFCHWLRTKTNLPYRLPTEVEWEHACRAGSTGAYGLPADGKLMDCAWFKDNSATAEKDSGTTHTLGSKKPNAFGLYDMHGNVAEWTLDLYDESTYASRAKDPLKAKLFNLPTEKKWGHVVRGGSFADTAEDCRSAKRLISAEGWMGEDPQFPRSVWWLTKMDTIGFRILLPVNDDPALLGVKPLVPKKGR